MKYCYTCGEQKPATPTYFHRQPSNRDGLNSVCKVCRNAHMRAYRQFMRSFLGDLYKSYNPGLGQFRRAWRLHAEEIGRPLVGSGEPKECPRCHEVKPLTSEYFHRALSRSNGYQAYCKACRSKAVHS